jgi:cob(I)alamin adenosyltransferase
VARIYTRTGDKGRTSLFAGGRVSKGHARLEAYGTLDELGAWLGWFASRSAEKDLVSLATGIQHDLFDLGARLATPPSATRARRALPPFGPDRTRKLEEAIDRLDSGLAPLTTFILAGGAEDSVLLQVARTVCRRGERAVVRAGRGSAGLDPEGLAYLNRLSDLLFVMARVVNARAGLPETPWRPGGGNRRKE